MAAAPEDGEREPFSPYVFLDLPPTPRDDGDDDPPLPDDLVLPYISRMLMEEDMDDRFFYHYPDHPALLQAQQPFADILSDADAATATATSSGSGFDSTDANGSGTAFTPSSYVDVVPAFASATWPYDPLELTQRLTAGAANSASSSLPGLEQAGSQFHESTDRGSQSHVQNRVSMDMINQAFLKGMEEANKFLPATSISSSSRGRRKNRGHDDLEEGETGRKSKLMAPEPEETGEIWAMVDKMVIDGYNLCVNKMKTLSITTSTTPEEANKSSSNLSTLLIHCAEAVSMDDQVTAAQLLAQIKKQSSPRGDASQSLAFCFAEGLEARLAGTGSTLYTSLVAKRTSVTEFLKAFQLYLAVSCFKMTANRFSNMTISKAIAGKKKLHIVDDGLLYGCQWLNLLDYLAKRKKGGPPEVRMTCIDLPEPGFRPTARVDETGRRLSKFARQCGLPFKFHGIAAKWETVRTDDLDIDADEVLVVNSITKFENLMDEAGIDDDIHSPSPRDVALFYYSAMFDMMDATVPWDSDLRLAVERHLIGRCALKVVACEGHDRVERPETYRQWQARNRKAGLSAPTSKNYRFFPNAVKILSEKMRNE
ncbi:scarecrow-like protein 14 [Miscanthus floridulus]|uniref:scarecrow-like protein 14 n=1 Tax=Miscanthus floridulus TaxID=154761 RepID=UPI003457CDBD